MALNDRQRAFVTEYVQCWNATEAARRAGYSERTASAIGYENLKKPEIAAEVERRVADLSMPANEVLIRLGEQARAAYADYMTEGGEVDLQRMIADGRGHLVRKIKPTRYGTEVEFYDAQAALVHIGKHHGLFDRGTPENPIVGVQMSLEEWRAEQARRRAQAAETTALFEESEEGA